MAREDFDDIVARILASGIVAKHAVDTAINEILTDKQEITEQIILEMLAQRGLISKWQARSISSGKFKGFIWEQYVILKLYPLAKNGFRIAEAYDRKNHSYALIRARSQDGKLQVEWLMPLSDDDESHFLRVSKDAILARSTGETNQ
jgi:hypothetical protein